MGYNPAKVQDSHVTKTHFRDSAEKGCTFTGISPHSSTDRKKDVLSQKSHNFATIIRWIPLEFTEGDHPLQDKPDTAEEVSNRVPFLISDESSHVIDAESLLQGSDYLL